MSTPSDRPNLQIVDVLRRDRRRRQRHARRVDALVLAEHAALDDRRLNLGAVGRLDAQLDRGRRRAAADRRDARSARGRRTWSRCRPGLADEIAGGDAQRVARRVSREAACRLRAGRCGSSGRRDPAGSRLRGRARAGRGAHARERRALRLVRAVREIEPEDVGAGGDERVEHRVGIAGGADRGDDLRVPHRRIPSRQISMGQIVPDAVERYLAGSNRAGDAVLDDIAREKRTRRTCRSSTPRSARCCACWRRPSAPRASSRSARRSATRASGSRARCRRTACC